MIYINFAIVTPFAMLSTDSDAAMLRERLENDLHSTKAALRQTEQQREDEGENSAMDTYNEERMHPELEVCLNYTSCQGKPCNVLHGEVVEQ